MKQYHFDEVIERHATSSVKYDQLKEVFGSDDLLPLWVADMDFRTPDFIVDALRKRCAHEVFGYTFASDDYYNSILAWLDYKYGWRVERDWISYIPGIVKGISFVVDCFSNEGDKIIIQPPVYHPFRLIPEGMGREVVYNPLRLTQDGYEMDFEQLETLVDEKCKIFILCSPHNPGGIVWPKETLMRLADFCHKHHILVISDEIHAEMTFPGNKHIPFSALSEAAAANSISFMAPSKTFNIAGIVSSYAVVPDPAVREKFFAYLHARELNAGTIFAYEATIAAYTYGAEWLQQMRQYVMRNVDYVDEYLQKHIPQIKVYRPQASFLLWLDCHGLGMKQEALVAFFIQKAKLALNDGSMFGTEGEGFMRMNIGCPRSVIDKALQQLEKAVADLG
ncbi:PatB family C-S lyase [Parabacteroides sp. PFB2-10]|uniref:MalY/PatB family protein n=1 Tax=Parabacteroides sp. PFB2-10 TaxID=1742405 RepID=UPI002476AB59|nr:PatB family C-S lyase [Parabacteroides sp. PFB2-10]